MGNTSSQPAAQTNATSATQSQSQSETQSQTQHAPSSPYDKEESNDAGSSPGSEIAVASPRSKVVTERTPQSPPTESMHERTQTPDVEAKPKKRKKSMEGAKARAPRGRPRDPSQLKPEVPTQPVVTNMPERDPDAQPKSPKRRKLSKADKHMLEIAGAILPNDDVSAGPTPEEAPVAKTKRKTKARRKPTGEDADRAPEETVDRTLVSAVNQASPEEAEDNLPEAADVLAHSESRRVSNIGEPGPKRRKAKALPPVTKAPSADTATQPVDPTHPKREKRKKRNPPPVQPVDEPMGIQAPDGPTANALVQPENPPVDQPAADMAGDVGRRKRKREQAGDSPVVEGALDQPSQSPSQNVGGQTVHFDGRRISAIGRPGPPKRKKQRVANGEVAPAQVPNAATVENEPTPRDSVSQRGVSNPTWPTAKRRYFGHAIAKYLVDLPENADKMPDNEQASEICEPNTTFVNLARDLKALGLRFSSSLLAKEIGRVNQEWVAAVAAAKDDAHIIGLPATPPDSPGVQIRYAVDATDQVRDWLNSQAIPSSAPSRPPSGTLRAVPDEENDDHSEYVPEPEQQATVQVSPDEPRLPGNSRKANIGRSTKVSLPAPVEHGPESGPFTNAEKAAADAVFDYVCQTQGLKVYELQAAICDWPTLGELKVELQDVLPNRTKAALRKFCHRRYTADATGPWTADQDERLRWAYAEEPDKWMSIGDRVGRTAQACRDRWRDHLQYEGKKVIGAWSQEEESKLVAAVEECIELIKDDAMVKGNAVLAGDRTRMEQMVDWKTVVDKLEGGRGRKRCREKWQSLKRRGADDGVSKPMDVLTVPQATAYNSQTKKQRAAEAKMKQFQYGDFYDVLVEIYTAIDDHSKQFRDESTIWSIVATRNKNSRFDGALRRRAYYAALQNYANGKKVGKATTIAAKAKAMIRSMLQWAEKNGIEEFTRGYDPVGGPPRKKAVPKVKKSENLVAESDDEADRYVAPKDGPLDNCEDIVQAVAGSGTDPDNHDDAETDQVDATDHVAEAPELMLEAVDDFPMSSVNSRYEASLSGRDPNMGGREFMARCRAVGRRQHRVQQRRMRV